ncbi:MAG: hypothetical protein EBU61_01145, partial [Crocinitomicaceae bacterium]|nr:hypothetical protein [Crocinitomicaceae bacterium]
MKKIIVSVTSDLSTDNRVDRTCKALLEYGFEVVLVGRIKSDSIDLENREYPCKRFKLFFQKGAFFYMEYNFSEIEKRSKDYWNKEKVYRVENPKDGETPKPKYYVLDMFPYPSGAGLHV